MTDEDDSADEPEDEPNQYGGGSQDIDAVEQTERANERGDAGEDEPTEDEEDDEDGT